MIRRISAHHYLALRGAVFVALAGLLLLPAASGDIILDEWMGGIDPNGEVPGSTTSTGGGTGGTGGTGGGGGEEEGYPTGGPGAPVRLVRIAPNAYWDAISEPSGQDRPNPRAISEGVIRQDGQDIRSPGDLSDMIWQWGQFLDHDIGITEPAGVEDLSIEVPFNDPWFDPLGVCIPPLPEQCFIRTTRSAFDPYTGTDPGNPRQQLNDLTALIDADNVYGHDAARTDELRDFGLGAGSCGQLKTSPGNFLPFNVNGFPNAPDASDFFFLAGDIRANETVPLQSMHTLWMREHNYVADSLLQSFPEKGGSVAGCEWIFQYARRIVITEMQVITFKEFFPAWLGNKAFPKYNGYDPNSDPGMVSVVSTAFYRLGHTMLSPNILRLRANGSEYLPPLALRDAFFQCQPGPTCRLINEGGLEPLMKGLSEKVMQRIDNMIVDDVRNFLFGPPGSGGLDLAALNINRGRDHGLPDYNTYRIYYGLDPVTSFAQINPGDPVVTDRLAATYGNVNLIDPWVGALAEEPIGGPGKVLVGELLFEGLSDQFRRIRDGDVNWYQNILPTNQQRAAEKTTLADIIARNTTLEKTDLNANVFIVK